MNDEKEDIDTEIPIEVSDEERALVVEALEEVNRGEVISHEEMKAYVEVIKERILNRKKQKELLKVGS